MREKQPPCQICVHRKKPSMSNIATLPFPLSASAVTPPSTYAFVVGYSCIANWAEIQQKKLKYGLFPLIEFRYHHILKSESHDETLIGCYPMLVQSGNRQNGRVGTFPCHSQDGSMRLLASAPWQRCTTDECRLIGLLQMEMAIAYNPIPACFVKGGNLQNTLLQLIWRNSQYTMVRCITFMKNRRIWVFDILVKPAGRAPAQK